MPKLPRSPSVAHLKRIDPDFQELPVGTRLWRVYFRGARHPTTWSAFRCVSPGEGGRFDHHLPDEDGEPQEQSRGILYAAMNAMTCFAEVFQKARNIDRWKGDPWLVAFDLASPLVLLDLTGAFVTRSGASMALMAGPRPVARRWSQGFYEAYPQIQGLYYPSSMHGNASAVALYERVGKIGAIPPQPSFHRALADAAMLTVIRNAARTLGYRLT